jgi:hypothetical protein
VLRICEKEVNGRDGLMKRGEWKVKGTNQTIDSGMNRGIGDRTPG